MPLLIGQVLVCVFGTWYGLAVAVCNILLQDVQLFLAILVTRVQPYDTQVDEVIVALSTVETNERIILVKLEDGCVDAVVQCVAAILQAF